MELNMVNKLLQEVALVHRVEDVNEKKALQNIALALMHIAKGIDELHRRS